MDCAADGGSADGDELGEFGGGVLSGLVEADEVDLLGRTEFGCPCPGAGLRLWRLSCLRGYAS